MNNLLFVIAQQQTNPIMTFAPLVLVIIVFYFFMIRPQMKRQKDLQKFRTALQKGDKIVTTGGIYGKISEIKDTVVLLEVSPNVKLKVDKSVILKDISEAPAQK